MVFWQRMVRRLLVIRDAEDIGCRGKSVVQTELRHEFRKRPPLFHEMIILSSSEVILI